MTVLKIILSFCFLFTTTFLYSQDGISKDQNQASLADVISVKVDESTSETPERQVLDDYLASENITLNFKDADIRNVLKIISEKSGVNIVAKPDVIGQITVNLENASWKNALDIILKTYNYGYVEQGSVIMVMKLEDVLKLQEAEPLRTDVFDLKFIDAHDAAKVIKPQLSSRGSVTVLDIRGQKGWKFGTFKIGKEEASTTGPERITETGKGSAEEDIKSKTIVVTDTATILDKIRNVVLPKIDHRPKQVLIQARIMEVNRDTLKDIGMDIGTGQSGVQSSTVTSLQYTPLWKGGSGPENRDKIIASGVSFGSQVAPSLFNPLSTAMTGVFPYNAGLQLILKKLTGAQLEVIIHALEEDADTNTLSSPSILTLDNQEAGILVGVHRPIIRSELTAGTTTTGPMLSKTLDYYQEIGIRLNVVPQVSENSKYVNLILHPSVTSSTANITATSVIGTGAAAITSTDTYPIINVREAQTQILIQDSETIVMGGLLKDVKSEEVIGTPFLKDLPLVGNLFKRVTNDTEKIDLLIFITAHILNDDEFTAEHIKELEKYREYKVPPKIVVLSDKELKKRKKK